MTSKSLPVFFFSSNSSKFMASICAVLKAPIAVAAMPNGRAMAPRTSSHSLGLTTAMSSMASAVRGPVKKPSSATQYHLSPRYIFPSEVVILGVVMVVGSVMGEC